MKKIFLIFCTLMLLSLAGYSQTDTEPKRIKKYIKKEKGKYGLYDNGEKQWLIPPEYDKITGIAFSEEDYEIENNIFYKLWKGNTFDLLRKTENINTFKYEFEIWVRDITAIQRPDIKAIREEKYSSKDYYNFMFYEKNGKWGWFVKELSYSKNILQDAIFTQVPTITNLGQVYEGAYNNYVLQVSVENNIGLHTLASYPLVKPGPYKGFKSLETFNFWHNIYKKDTVVTIVGENNLLGYALNGVSVDPAYTSFNRKRSPLLNLEYFVCTLPNGAEELRNGTVLFTKEELQAMENAENKRRLDFDIAYKKEKEAEAKLQPDIENVKDSTIFVKTLNGYTVFKLGNTFGLKDQNNKIIFPAVLNSIDQGLAKSFDILIEGKEIESASFGTVTGGSHFSHGKMNCDVCNGSGLVPTTFHISRDIKSETYERYLGNGVWKKITVTTTTPAYDAIENTPCKRCDGFGKMLCGVNFNGETINIWIWKDELEKTYRGK